MSALRACVCTVAAARPQAQSPRPGTGAAQPACSSSTSTGDSSALRAAGLLRAWGNAPRRTAQGPRTATVRVLTDNQRLIRATALLCGVRRGPSGRLPASRGRKNVTLAACPRWSWAPSRGGAETEEEAASRAGRLRSPLSCLPNRPRATCRSPRSRDRRTEAHRRKGPAAAPTERGPQPRPLLAQATRADHTTPRMWHSAPLPFCPTSGVTTRSKPLSLLCRVNRRAACDPRFKPCNACPRSTPR